MKYRKFHSMNNINYEVYYYSLTLGAHCTARVIVVVLCVRVCDHS